MNELEIETHTLAAIDRARSGQKVEDSRVELKREWPSDLAKAARRIAGHCNAARSKWILWVIGLSEEGLPRTGPEPETQDWLGRLRKHFDGPCPKCVDLRVTSGGEHLTALYFECARAPYVVKNPAFGTATDGVELEVPWRDGTKVRSARRDELLRMLGPLQSIPQIEEVWSQVQYGRDSENGPLQWKGRIQLFISPSTDAVLLMPLFKMKWWASWDNGKRKRPLYVYADRHHRDPMLASTALGRTNDYAIICHGPDVQHFYVSDSPIPPYGDDAPATDLKIEVSFGLLGEVRTPVCTIPLTHTGDKDGYRTWESDPKRHHREFEASPTENP